ncbi:MAG: MATE family efflux transporter [Rhizobiaceae bacterium]|nr:MATE family efflux transporter [Rhizobiaceae bacterium]
MNETVDEQDNMFLSGSLPILFIKTAAPIILIMMVNGFHTLIDAYFLGEFVGADALTAVTLMFPAFMLLVALSTLVSNGYSSILARLLGAGEKDRALNAYVDAILLALVVCVVLIAMFLAVGDTVILWVTKGSTTLAAMGYTYMAILIFLSPLAFVLGISIDTLRCEGMLATMAAITLMSVLANTLFNYILIVEFNWGVAGSAYGTILAQACAMAAIIVVRIKKQQYRSFQLSNFRIGWHNWSRFLALGAPTSLSYVGISLSAAAILFSLQLWSGSAYEATATAYGIVTRVMTFMFLPLLGLSMAFQTIVGNNYGAHKFGRTNACIKIVLSTAFVYCVIFQLCLYIFRNDIGFIFVDDQAIALQLARILPLTTMVLFIFGPLMMVSVYFQAIGDATRSAILSLTKVYLFSLPLTFILPMFIGEIGIWYAGPLSEILSLLLTAVILYLRFRKSQNPWGLFTKVAQSA